MRGRVIQPLVLAVSAVGLVAAGAAGATLVLRGAGNGTTAPAPAAPAAAAQVVAAPEPPVHAAAEAATPAASGAEPASLDLEVLLSPDGVAQAGIKTAKVGVGETSARLEVPGTITANAYRDVKVIAVAGGIVRMVHAELGSLVRRGAPLATVFSTELADAQTKYLSMSAQVDADRRKLERTRELAEIGAASRQELEEIAAAYTSRATEAAAARQRLLLLGLTRAQVDALSDSTEVVSDVWITAPIGGVVTSRTANLGQVVGAGQELFAVTDLSTVWAVADVYERDFETVRVGVDAAITTAAYPGLTLRGRVAYIDPKVDPQTRTAKVRVEVSNRDGRLRLGMFVGMSFAAPGGRRLIVPRTAIQTIGDRQVVFVPFDGEEGRFARREVRLGPQAGDGYVVLEGLQAGESVVTEGSFLLRAESLRNSPS
jgi:cobalt-zinc-cadmium efflux system membrane fusion protein